MQNGLQPTPKRTSADLGDLGDLTIVIIHYQTPTLLRRCLDRLRVYAPGARLVVTNNYEHDSCEHDSCEHDSSEHDSSDCNRSDYKHDDRSNHDGLEPLQTCYPDVYFIHTLNHSFAHAVNTGLKASTTPFVAHMNADVMVGPNTFSALLNALVADDTIGMVGPRCATPAGNWQDQGLLYRWHHGRLARSRHYAVDVGWLSGCVQLLRRDVVAAVGGMDTRLRFYNEDMEWCGRLRAAGYRCRLVKTDVMHLGGAATPGAARFWLEGLRGGYLLSARTQPRWVRAGHRWGLKQVASLARHVAKHSSTRSAWHRFYRRLRDNDLVPSPFGPTLADDNPEF